MTFLQGNLKDPQAVEKAALAKSRLQQTPAYRDRAAERRIALNQPDKPVRDQPNFKRVKVEAPPAPEPPPEQPNKEGIEESNIGRKMLEAAGWSQGEGLGAGGLAAPIEARQYQAGAGLGAASSTAISDLPSHTSFRGADRGRKSNYKRHSH